MATKCDLRLDDITALEKSLDIWNKTSLVLRSLTDKVEKFKTTANRDTQEYQIAVGSHEGVNKCKSKLDQIKTKIDQLFNDEQRPYYKDLLRMITMKSELNIEVYECLICLSAITKSNEIWSCQDCHNILHLTCVKHYGIVCLESEPCWTCPVCRKQQATNPRSLQYYCFCKKFINPEMKAGVAAHSCGSICRKRRNCVFNCHPAACPINL